MFEVLLGTRGIMQLGWATVNCQFNNEVEKNFIHLLMYICCKLLVVSLIIFGSRKVLVIQLIHMHMMVIV